MTIINAAGPPSWPHRLGKRPAKPKSVQLRMASYFKLAELPVPPDHFRYPNPPKWIDYGNSDYGDCVWSGAANETTLWELEGGEPLPVFTVANILSDYSAVTGFDPAKEDTDKGTDIGDAFAYRRKTGIVDASGKRHKVDAYCKIRLRNEKYLKASMWLFGSVGLGFRFPDYAMKQFDSGKVWDIKSSGGKVTGGHYVPAVGIAPNGNIICVSWGKEVEMTIPFYTEFADEVSAALDIERLDKKTMLSPENFDKARLTEDLRTVSSGWGIYNVSRKFEWA